MEAATFESWDTFLENATIGVHLVDEQGKVLWANRAELDFLGYQPEEYFGKSITEFHEDRDVIERILTILLADGELHAYPARLRAKDGSLKFVLINSNVYRDGEEFVHTRCFTSEISQIVYEQLRDEQGQG